MQQTSARMRALTYLQIGIDSARWLPGSRLPSIRRLAHDSGIGNDAMQAAVRILAEKGLVTVLRNKGIYVGTLKPHFPPALQTQMRWEEIKQSLLHDMTFGVFEDQVHLPNTAQMEKQYSVSIPTLRKAIKDLIREGALKNDKKKYRIIRMRKPSQFTRLLLISPGISLTKLEMYSGKFNDFYEALESRCIRSNIHLAYCGVTADNHIEVQDYLKKNKTFFGYCLFAAGPETSFINSLAQLVDTQGRPIALVSEFSPFPLPRLKGPARLFYSAGFLAGRQAGHFLQELGHKRIAYVSRYHNTEWSQQRYDGLKKAFTETGSSDCVRLMSIPDVDTRPAMDDPAIIRAIEKITGINSKFPLRKGIPAVEEYGQILPRIRGLLSLRGQYRSVWKHFEELFKDATITAVVGSQDYTAILAHEFLKEKGVDVPGEISLIGFDNHEMALQDDLTSYHFLFSNIAADVLAYIINPSDKRFAGRREIECGGAIIQRSTTGPARPVS
jgi:DNA-binding LacI/PurR family transcriptional regulator